MPNPKSVTNYNSRVTNHIDNSVIAHFVKWADKLFAEKEPWSESGAGVLHYSSMHKSSALPRTYNRLPTSAGCE